MNRMLTRTLAHGLAALIATAPIILQSARADDTPQSRMAACSKANKGMKGDDFKKAQSDCLKKQDVAEAAPMTPQQKMSMCSKKNKGMKGDDFKKAQSDCLKG